MRILLLSAYDAASHRQWRQGLENNLTEHDWTVLTLPDRYFSWRVRGNALSWAAEQGEILQQPYDAIVATSMVDLATLKGVQPGLSATPAILYFHENQFAYPESASARPGVEAQITSIYSAMAAKRLLFNSRYNRDTFILGAKTLLKKMPDFAPLSVIDALQGKSDILPVPVAEDCFGAACHSGQRPFTLVWNHRWEYDKGPERLYLVLKRLQQAGQDFRVHVIGQRFRKQPEAFADIRRQFAARILSWVFVEMRQDYLDVLRSSDVVLSTSLHDFQGISMLEAVACGCIPVAPDRMAYPEMFPASLLSPGFDDADRDAEALVARLLAVAGDLSRCRTLRPDLQHLCWPEMADKYRAQMQALVTP